MLIDTDDETFRQLAYTFGNLIGDGSLGAYARTRKAGTVKRLKTDRQYVQCTVTFGSLDIESMERVREEIEAVFGNRYAIHPRTLKSGRIFHILATSSASIFDFFAVNTALKTRIPEWYYSAADEAKRALLAGLMDTDGYISQRDFPTYSTWNVGFGMNERGIVESAATLLHSLGVQVGKIGTTTKGQYRTLHRFQANAKSYAAAGCYFVANRKQEKLAACASYRQASETRYAAPLVG